MKPADLIPEIDDALSLVRGIWISAATVKERERSRKRLDELLDQRLGPMRLRDASKRGGLERLRSMFQRLKGTP